MIVLMYIVYPSTFGACISDVVRYIGFLRYKLPTDVNVQWGSGGLSAAATIKPTKAISFARLSLRIFTLHDAYWNLLARVLGPRAISLDRVYAIFVFRSALGSKNHVRSIYDYRDDQALGISEDPRPRQSTQDNPYDVPGLSDLLIKYQSCAED